MIKVWDYAKEYELLREDILDAVDDVFKNGPLIFGPRLEEFEEKFSNFHECKANLDRIQDASYIDLTYRIRWDSDRLDLFRSTNREILICDGNLLTTYVHNKRRDPDWWMIVRNSLGYIDCADEILIEEID